MGLVMPKALSLCKRPFVILTQRIVVYVHTISMYLVHTKWTYRGVSVGVLRAHRLTV